MRFLAVPWGVLIGYLAAWTLWMSIYGIGTRVIQDWEHYEYASRVQWVGTVAGGLIGLFSSILIRRPMLFVLLGHLCAGLVAFAALNMLTDSWRLGLVVYAGVLGVCIVVGLTVFSPRGD